MVKNDFKNDGNAEFVCDLVAKKFWEQTSSYTCEQLRKQTNYTTKELKKQ